CCISLDSVISIGIDIVAGTRTKPRRRERGWQLQHRFARSTTRASYLREGLKRVGRVIVFALVMDAIYQFLVLRWFYPGEALVTAFVLAVLPYLLIRGPAARIARHWHPRGAPY